MQPQKNAAPEYRQFTKGDAVQMRKRTGTVLHQMPGYGSTQVRWSDGKTSWHQPHLLKLVGQAERVEV